MEKDTLNKKEVKEELVKEEIELEELSMDMADSIEETRSEATIEVEERKDVSIHLVLDSIHQLNEKMDTMNNMFIQKIKHTSHEEKIVDQMHSELQKYKEDLYSQLVRPILLDIIDIRDSILRMSKAYSLKAENEQSIPLKVFSDYAYDVQDILENNNITIYKGEEGDTYTPIKQKVIKKIITPVEDLHGKIAESISCGYDYMGKTISPEKIAVYVYEKPVNTEGENE